MSHAAKLAAALILAAIAAPASAQKMIADVPLAMGVERVLLATPSGPQRAILVMLPGGDGMVEFDSLGNVRRLGSNFLIRTMPLWLAQGFAVAILGSPNGASLMGQRHTPSYADAIGRAVDFLRTKVNAPVWLIGTSQGSTAAANGAAHLGGKIAGVVLTSSVTRENQSGETLFDSEPAAITVPTLIVANEGDTCRSTPPADTAQIIAWLSRSPRREVILMQSHQIQSPACEAMSPHGFFGIEAVVVQRISNWILTTPTH